MKKGLKFLDDKLKMTKIAKGLFKVIKNGVTIGRLTLKRSWLARLLVNLLKQKVEAEKKKAIGAIEKAVRDLEEKLVQTVATVSLWILPISYCSYNKRSKLCFV